MNAGDQKYVYRYFRNGNVEYQTVEGEADTNTIAFYMGNYFKNKKKSDRKYNYNVINTHLILNYAMFKSGDNSVYFFKVPNKF